MKLTDLEPRWIGCRWDALDDIIFGMTFRCPHCLDQRLAIFFSSPIGDASKLTFAAWADPRQDKVLWDRSGDSFNTLTISPSIDASASGHWHGFITNGEVT